MINIPDARTIKLEKEDLAIAQAIKSRADSLKVYGIARDRACLDLWIGAMLGASASYNEKLSERLITIINTLILLDGYEATCSIVKGNTAKITVASSISN
jgi:hypothetical protein